MDIGKVIRDLNEERKRLERIIEALETMAKTGEGYLKPAGRRGRKFMDSADRLEVSERMRRYWARRREEKTKAAAATDHPPSTAERTRLGGIGSLTGPAERAVYVS